MSANLLKFLVSGFVILRSEIRDFDFVHETRGGRPTRTTVVKSFTLAWSIIPFYKCLSVCLSICSHISKTRYANFDNFSCMQPGAVVRSSFDDDVYPVFNHLKVIVMSPLENLCSITSIDVTSISIIHSNSLCFMDE